jgi:hypothetical protein
MRFRYIDSKGKEITLDSVEALATRIELGAVGADTELFDASTDTWGRADTHEIFRQLLAEAAAHDFAATPETPSLDAPAASMAAESPVAEGPSVDEPELQTDAPFIDDAEQLEGLTLATGVFETVQDALNEASAEALGRLQNADSAEALNADEESPESHDYDLNIGGDLEVEGYDPADFNEVAASREPAMDGFSASPGADVPTVNDAWPPEEMDVPAPPPPAPEEQGFSGALEIDDGWASESDAEPHPFDDDPFAGSASENGGWPAEALLEDQAMAAPSPNRFVEMLSAPAVQWGFLGAAFVVMAVFGSSVGSGILLRALLTVGGVSFVGLATGFLLWNDPERRTLIPAATFGLIAAISVPLFLIGSKAQAAQSPPSQQITRERTAESSAGVPAGPANPGELAMEGRAVEEMVEGMDSLAISYGLDRRPADWLHGVYLANASRYPSVEEYWTRYAEYVAEVRAQDVDWFAASYEARLQAAGIQTEAVTGLVERGIQRFEANRSSREGLYDTMEDLAISALELHALLLANEDNIDWEPFRQTGVSEAPVVEAIPNSPELEDAMWGLIARVALSLESISDIGETSPEHLQDALLDSIRSSTR